MKPATPGRLLFTWGKKKMRMHILCDISHFALVFLLFLQRQRNNRYHRAKESGSYQHVPQSGQGDEPVHAVTHTGNISHGTDLERSFADNGNF